MHVVLTSLQIIYMGSYVYAYCISTKTKTHREVSPLQSLDSSAGWAMQPKNLVSPKVVVKV